MKKIRGMKSERAVKRSARKSLASIADRVNDAIAARDLYDEAAKQAKILTGETPLTPSTAQMSMASVLLLLAQSPKSKPVEIDGETYTSEQLTLASQMLFSDAISSMLDEMPKRKRRPSRGARGRE